MAGIRCFFAVKIHKTNPFEQFIHRQDALQWGKVKWSKPDHLHITLRFIGELPAGRLDQLLRRLTEWNFDVPVFDFLVEGIGLFRSIHRPRVLWAGIKEQEAFQLLHHQLNELLYECLGIDDDSKHYHPHLTLGRIKKLHNPDVLKQQIDENQHLLFGSFRAREILLVESKISEEGAEYIPLGRKRLDPMPPDNC